MPLSTQSSFVWTRGRVFNSGSQGTRFKSGLVRLTLLEDTFVLIVAFCWVRFVQGQGGLGDWYVFLPSVSVRHPVSILCTKLCSTGLCINYRAKFTPGWPTANTGLLYKLLRTKLDFYNESNTRREASLPHSFNRENRENITFKS